MPGVSLKNLPPLCRPPASFNKSALLTGVGCAIFCLGLPGPALATDSIGGSSVVPTPEIIVTSHLLDGQNRIITSKLSPRNDAKAKATALYAAAMLALDDPKSNLQSALDQLRQVATLDPHFPDAQVEIANLLLRLGQISPALDQLQTAFAANPRSVDIESALAYVQRLRGQNEMAVKLAKDALIKDPTQPTAMRVILEVAADQQDTAGGVLHIEDILKASGSKAPASSWMMLAKLYVEIAHTDTHPTSSDALSRTLLPIYQQAASKPPVQIETLTALADTYRDLGLKREALITLREGIAIDPSNVDIILRCAKLETELGQTAQAIKHYEEAYTLGPTLSGLSEALGSLYLANGRFDDAARLGCPPESYLQLVVYQLEHDQVPKSAATLAAARKRFPNSAKVRFFQAVQYRYENNYAAAIFCLDQTRELAIGAEAAVLDPEYYLECSKTFNLAGENQRFQAVLQEGLTKFPNNADLMNELAYFWADQGTHLPEAFDLSKRAIELEPNSGPIQDTRGWVSFKMGEAKDALPYLQRAAFLTNNDPVVLQHLGDTYMKLGQRSDAIATWRLGLEKAPRNGDLANRIDAALAQAKNAHTRSASTHP